MRLILIRHAETTANVAGVLAATEPGPSLTEFGRRQAAALPAALAHEPIRAIYVSRLIRTSLTAAPLAAALGLEPRVVDGIQEISAGVYEGRSDPDAIRAYLAPPVAWGEGRLEERLDGGESGHEFAARFDGALAAIEALHPDETVAVVSHGAALRIWSGGRTRNLTPAFSHTHDLTNTAVIVVNGDPREGWVVESWSGEPIGGEQLADAAAVDPTGEAPL